MSFDEVTAQRLLEEGKLAESLSLAEDALEADPNDPCPHGIKANVLMFMGRDQEGMNILRTALARWPDNWMLLLRLGLVCNKLHYHEEAIECFNRVLEHGSSRERARARWGLADALAYSKHYSDAVNMYDQVVGEDPQNGAAWIGRSLALYWLGQYQQALDSVDRGIHLWPGHPSAATLRRRIMDSM